MPPPLRQARQIYHTNKTKENRLGVAVETPALTLAVGKSFIASGVREKSERSEEAGEEEPPGLPDLCLPQDAAVGQWFCTL